MWGRRALERRGRETLGSLEQRKRPTLWVADGLTGLGRDGPPCERRTDVGAGDAGSREQALSDE